MNKPGTETTNSYTALYSLQTAFCTGNFGLFLYLHCAPSNHFIFMKLVSDRNFEFLCGLRDNKIKNTFLNFPLKPPKSTLASKTGLGRM